MKRGLRILLGLGAVLLALTGSSQSPPPPENLRLVVWLRPAPPGVVPLQPGERTLYTFEVFGFDEAKRQIGISEQVFVHEGRRRGVHRSERGLELNGVVDLRDGEAKYQVKLLIHGRQVAATAASLKLGGTER